MITAELHPVITDAYLQEGHNAMEAFLTEAATVGAVAATNTVEQQYAATDKYLGGKFKVELPANAEINNADAVPAMDLEAIAAQKAKDINSKIALIKREDDVQAAINDARRIDFITFSLATKKDKESDEDD